MATQNKTLWTASDPTNTQNVASLSISYDDVLLRILSVTIRNPTSKTVNYSAKSTSTGRTYSGTIPPNRPKTTVTLNNTQAQNRLDITITANGRLDGVEYNLGLG